MVEKVLQHVMTEEEEVSGITEEKEGEVIAGIFPLAVVDLRLQRLEFPLVEGEEEEEVVEEVTLLLEDCFRQSVMVVEQEVLILGVLVLEIFPFQQRHHPASL